jgi:hypothetical protein
MPTSLIPALIAVHVTLAVGLFLPSILLPFAMRRPALAADRSGRLVRGLLRMQSHGTVALALGLALTGLALVAAIGGALLAQPWLLVALLIYALNLGLALFIQRPNVRRLVGLGGPTTADDRTWAIRARRHRYVSYAMAGLVGTIGALMSAKPELW